MLPSNQKKIIEQAKFGYSRLRKALEKQTEKQVGALKPPNKKDELKQSEGIFPPSQMNDLIGVKLKKNC